MKISENRYKGIVIELSNYHEESNVFRNEIVKLVHTSSGKELLWVKIPIEKSEYIPILTKLNFEFHHCDERNLMLIKKLKSTSFVPTTKNYIVGVGAIVMHNNRLLVIKDRLNAGYKLPGGHIDKNESIKDALKREVEEETGVHIEFESILNLGHFRNGQFGESNLYIVCTGKALTEEININDTSEIIEAKWISIEAFMNDAEVNDYNKSVVRAAINNAELKLKEQKIKLRVTTGEVFF